MIESKYHSSSGILILSFINYNSPFIVVIMDVKLRTDNKIKYDSPTSIELSKINSASDSAAVPDLNKVEESFANFNHELQKNGKPRRRSSWGFTSEGA